MRLELELDKSVPGGGKRMNNEKKGYALQASYTVEAAFIMPIMLWGIMKGVLFGIELCEEQHTQANEIVQQEQECPVETIRRYELYEDIWDYVTREEEDAD